MLANGITPSMKGINLKEVNRLEAEIAAAGEAFRDALKEVTTLKETLDKTPVEEREPIKDAIAKRDAQLVELQKRMNEANRELYFLYVNQYAKNNNRDAGRIMEDLRISLDILELPEFEAYIGVWEEIARLEKAGAIVTEKEINTRAEKLSQRNFPNFARFVLDRVIDLQIDALVNIEADLSDIKDLVAACYTRLFNKPVTQEEIEAVEWIFSNYRDKKPAPLPILKPTKVDKVGFPIDKINAISTGIWGAISKEPGGQLAFSFDTSNQKKKGVDEAAVLCAISWNDPKLTITRNLTEWDKRVYIAVGSLFTGGNETMTINQIYTLMGNTGNPNARTQKEINDSLTKMGTARLYLDNVKERNAGYKYPKAKYDAPLLPFERLEVTNRGQTTTAIHLLREPPLLTFAKARKQCTTIDIKVLQSPISKTNNNLRIDDYLLERITHMKKNQALSRKILLSTIYEVCKVTSKMQKSRTPEKIFCYLNHYQATGFIKGFIVDGTKKPYSDYKEGSEDKPKTIKESVTIIL